MFMDPSVSGGGLAVDCYEHCSGSLGSVRRGKVLWLVKQDVGFVLTCLDLHIIIISNCRASLALHLSYYT